MRDFNLDKLAEHPTLTKMFNKQLIRLGLLDPSFTCNLSTEPGPNLLDQNPALLRWTLDGEHALRRWFVLNNLPLPEDDVLPGDVGTRFFADTAKPFTLATDANGVDRLCLRVAERMRRERFYVNRGLGINTVYLEGCNPDGSANADRPNEWNDVCIWFTVDQLDVVRGLGTTVGTTEPGRKYTLQPMHRDGAARLAFGQYKAWVYGLHLRKQPALVQNGPLKVWRDKDFSMTRSKKDKIMIVYNAGINQHSTGPGLTPKLVGPWSAGCLVKLNYEHHVNWLEACKQDYRAKVGNYTHVAGLLAGPL